jgi:Uma2 family endonuclease
VEEERKEANRVGHVHDAGIVDVGSIEAREGHPAAEEEQEHAHGIGPPQGQAPPLCRRSFPFGKRLGREVYFDLGEPMKATKHHESPGLITGEDLGKMSGLGRCELVRGRIVHASPTSRQHAKVEVRFAHELHAFVKSHRLGEVLAGEAGVYTQRGPDTVRGADVAFLSAERASRCRQQGFLDIAPDLVVEVLSPGDRHAQVEEKIAEYLTSGVRLVWVADPARKSVRVYRSLDDVRSDVENAGGSGRSLVSGGTVVSGEDLLCGEDVLPGFSVPVRHFFDD